MGMHPGASASAATGASASAAAGSQGQIPSPLTPDSGLAEPDAETPPTTGGQAWLDVGAASATASVAGASAAAAAAVEDDLLDCIQHGRFLQSLDLIGDGYSVAVMGDADKTYAGIRKQLRGKHYLWAKQ
jgi:hypothetical protein